MFSLGPLASLSNPKTCMHMREWTVVCPSDRLVTCPGCILSLILCQLTYDLASRWQQIAQVKVEVWSNKVQIFCYCKYVAFSGICTLHKHYFFSNNFLFLLPIFLTKCLYFLLLTLSKQTRYFWFKTFEGSSFFFMSVRIFKHQTFKTWASTATHERQSYSCILHNDMSHKKRRKRP